jgi:RNA polymerase sigma factor (sigma-70 family)
VTVLCSGSIESHARRTAAEPGASDAALALLRIGRHQALAYGLDRDEANDCASAFVLHMLGNLACRRVSQSVSVGAAAQIVFANRQGGGAHAGDVAVGADIAWTRRCAANFACNWKRSRRRRLCRERPWCDFDDSAGEPDRMPREDTVADPRVPSLEALTLRRVADERLHGFVSQLPDAHRDLLIRHHVDGEPLEDLAVDYGMTEGAVQQLLFRLRRKLRTWMSAAYEQ